jgi:methionine aminotransferase
MKILSKQPNLGLSIFAEMTALANEHRAINLSQGFPDFNPPEELTALVNRFMREGHNQYAPMPGALKLRERLSEKYERDFGAVYHPDSEITITAGATEALYEAITAVVHAGDEVIVFEPFYDAYAPVIRYCGGAPKFIKLNLPDFNINWEALRKAVTHKTRLIIFNSPHNPAGAVLTEEDMRALIEIVRNRDVLLLSDEVYEHIIFDGEKHRSFSSYPELAERSFVVGSFGKSCHATGWKIGYCVAPREMTAELRKLHQFVTFAVNTPIQLALAEFMNNREHFSGISVFYQQKRDYLRELLKSARFKLLPCRGTYFQLADFSGISDEPEKEFAVRLIREHGVAAVPLSPFYENRDNHHLLRFCFAKQEETLNRAAERLAKL